LPLVSIGIPAWNEERNIEQTLCSLFDQSVFVEAEKLHNQYKWEIVVVPNGCSDATASKARDALERLFSSKPNLAVGCKVVELESGGKSNAWNHYVHEFSDSSADYLILIDADIEFGHPRTIENVLKAIKENPVADVIVDLPLKDIVKKEKPNWFEKLSISASNISLSGPPGISGSFYCARASLLRQIWMPEGLSSEDGYLRAMVITNLFRSPVDESRVVRAADASHYYEAESTLSGIFQHQVRMVIGTTFNCYLTWDTLHFATDPDGPGAGVTIRNRTRNDPHWYPRFINNCIKNHGWWVLPRGMVFGRYVGLNELKGFGWLRRFIVLTAGLLFDLPVMLYANHKIKSGNAVGFW